MTSLSRTRATEDVRAVPPSHGTLAEISLGPANIGRDQDLREPVDLGPAAEVDYGPGCGWHFCFSGRCVQHSRTAKWLLFWMCCAAAVQGMVVNGFINVSITTIEKRFRLKSRSTGIIASSYDIASVLVVVPVSYLGSRPGASKPRWLGLGLICMGLGSFVFLLPHFLIPPYEGKLHSVVNGSDLNEFCYEQVAQDGSCNGSADGSWLSNFLYVFILGQLLHGVGATPIYTLGMVFIDESVPLVQSSFYLGIFSAMAVVGPAFGYAIGGQFLKAYIDAPSVDPARLGLVPSSDRWLGGWWMGFFLSGSLALLVAVPILLIPAVIPSAVAVPAGGGGTFLGGWVIKKFRMGCSSVIRLCLLISIACTLACFFFFVHCPNNTFAGVSTPYHSLSSVSSPNVSSPCNIDCGCGNVTFNPVCGANNIIYFSPCHAGCTKSNQAHGDVVFSNCACVEQLPAVDSVASSHPSLSPDQATPNACPNDCGYLPLFVVAMLVVMFATFFISMPNINGTLRCVETENRGLALGLQAISFRVLGTIPGPLLYGNAIDHACVLWGQTCGVPGSCVAYDNSNLSKYMFAICFTAKFISTVAFFIAWRIRSAVEARKVELSSEVATISVSVGGGLEVDSHYRGAHDNPALDPI